MIYADDLDDDGYDPDDDWYDDRDDWREPDPEDYEIARANEEYAEHCEQKHGGADCDCRAPLSQRISWRLREMRIFAIRLGRGRRYTDEPPF